MLGGSQGIGGTSQRTGGLWPLASAPVPPATSFTSDGYSKYGFYSLFAGAPTFGSTLYSHNTVGRFGPTLQSTGGAAFHTTHKVSDSLFSTTGYTTFAGAPTPPPGSPYSPVPAVTQLEFLTKGHYTTTTNSNSIIIQAPTIQDLSPNTSHGTPSPKKQHHHHHHHHQLLTPEKDVKNHQGFRQQTYKQQQQQQQYVYQHQPGLDSGCMLKLTALSDKDQHGGCSRTNPLEWTTLSPIHVKKEPGTLLLSDCGHQGDAIIKMEMTSPVQQKDLMHQTGSMPSIVTTNGNIPVGIAVGRQRIQQEVAPSGILTTTHFKEVARISEIGDMNMNMTSLHHHHHHHQQQQHAAAAAAAADMMQPLVGTAGNIGNGSWTPLGCSAQLNHSHAHQQQQHMQHPGQTQQQHTLWQYPAPLPMEPLLPMSAVGLPLQLVREPTSGGFLLFPTTGMEPVQQTAVLWPTTAATATLPTYHTTPSPHHVLLPPLPPPPLQLLTTSTAAAADYQLTSSSSCSSTSSNTSISSSSVNQAQTATLQCHSSSSSSSSTRVLQQVVDGGGGGNVIVRGSRGKQQTMIKVEEGLGGNGGMMTATMDSQHVSTPMQTTIYEANPLLTTTHLIYQPSPMSNNVIVTSQHATEMTPAVITSRSQATSPVTCLTPPPELGNAVHMGAVVTELVEEPQEEPLKAPEEVEKQVQDASNQTDSMTDNSDEEGSVSMVVNKADVIREMVEQEQEVLAKELTPEEEVEPSLEVEGTTPDFSGLDLLSNSILEHETSKISIPETEPEEPPIVVEENNLGGLDLLCALAEQRLEEVSCENKKPEVVTKRRDEIDDEEPETKKLKLDDGLIRRCNNCNCNVDDEYKNYRTKESEEEVKKFIASKSPTLSYDCKEWSGDMNDSERDMRQQLADLQRKYKEKQRELNKLKPHHHISKKKHRKKSTHSTDRDSPLPPVLEPQIERPVTPENDPEAPPALSPMPMEEVVQKVEKRRHSSTSKRRRKVGRPKKLEWSSDNETNTIVSKKPKKTNLVGYLLAAKEKLVQETYSDSPPRFVEEASTPVKSRSKIGPKLKAEARVSMEIESDTDQNVNKPFDAIDIQIEEHAEEAEEPVQQQQEDVTSIQSEDSNDEGDKSTEEEVTPSDNNPFVDTRCILTTELLESDRLRVLTAMGGLFYAGNLNAVQPPDVYSITLDGERGNRPHIMSREEILRDAIVEVSPCTTEELQPGTRLCAYWSQQYRCLYPGSVAEPASPSASPRELDKRFVSVEFDDGDNGTIAIEDIRLLPADYPIIEYDPNPLLSLSKRKRRLSTTEDRKVTQSPTISSNKKSSEKAIESTPTTIEKENKDVNTDQARTNKERKRLKKRKRDKLREKQRLKGGEDINKVLKKKKRKHKCLGEQCKHRRHHKKHKKHRRHHHSNSGRGRKVTINEKVDVIEDENATVEIEENLPEYHIVPNPEDEVTMDDIIQSTSKAKTKKIRDRQESCESRSKMSAFLPPRQFWSWSGKGYKRPRGKGRSKKEFFKSIQRGKESMSVGDSAVFLSTGRPDRPYIGKIEAMWETCGTMVVKVKWFYHPEETNGCPLNLKYPGALFESPHIDENDVQTISHRCRVVPLVEYTATLGSDPTRYATIYDNNDIYYRAGYYDPTTCQLNMEDGIPLEE